MPRLPLALCCFALSGCASPELGVEYRGELLDTLDMHLHIGDWASIPERSQDVIAGNFPFPLGLDAAGTASGVVTGEGVLEQLDGAGIRRGVLFAVYAPRTVGIATNEEALEQIAADPTRLLGLASLRFDHWGTDAQAELDALRAALGEPGMVGIKLAHAHQHVRFDDPAYFGVYAIAAELDVPVYLHTGLSPFPGTSQEAPYTDAGYLEPAITSFPTVRFILGHLGHDFEPEVTQPLDTVLDLAERFENVWLEPSALRHPDDFRLTYAMDQIRSRGLVSRTIYGSDGPQSPGFVGRYVREVVDAMDAADYTIDEAADVLARNFDRAFQQ
jgi:predicted TIM-barrel fold metal-dependent hydrolase